MSTPKTSSLGCFFVRETLAFFWKMRCRAFFGWVWQVAFNACCVLTLDLRMWALVRLGSLSIFPYLCLSLPYFLFLALRPRIPLCHFPSFFPFLFLSFFLVFLPFLLFCQRLSLFLCSLKFSSYLGVRKLT